jgi:hypothetical protein
MSMDFLVKMGRMEWATEHAYRARFVTVAK